jgi:hypothetical protein
MAKKPVKTSVLAGKPDAYQQALQQRQNIVQQQAQENKKSQPGIFTPAESSIKKHELGTPSQRKLNESTTQKAQQLLRNYNPQPRSWEPYEQLARQGQQRNRQSLAERFHGLSGSGFGPGSTAFQGLSENDAQFEAQLAAAKAEFDMMNDNNQLSNFSTLSGLAQSPQYGYEHIEGQPSYAGTVWDKASGPLIGAGLGWLGGGPAGAIAGGSAGLLNSLFGSGNKNQSAPISTSGQGGMGGASGFTQRNNPLRPGTGTPQQGQQNNPQNMQRIYQLLASQFRR